MLSILYIREKPERLNKLGVNRSGVDFKDENKAES